MPSSLTRRKNRARILIKRSASPQGTARVAAALAPRLTGGTVILLRGPVGSGKTLFIGALARRLGVRRPLRSPTFVLTMPYRLDLGPIRWFVHADGYRLHTRSAFVSTGLTEWLGRPDAVVAVEWPGHLFHYQKLGRVITVDLAPRGWRERIIKIRFPS